MSSISRKLEPSGMAFLPPSIFLLVLLAGCATGGGARWYAPATWFSRAPAVAIDKAEKREDVAREAVIKAAQKSSHETSLALAAAPASRPVAVAGDANASTVALLDQAAGPLDAATLARLRSVITGLLSDNAGLREAAEKQHSVEQGNIAEVSASLARAEEARAAATEKLRAAFDRENALANELRSQRAAFWIAGSIALCLALGWAYAQFALGGIPAAAGRLMRDLRASKPDLAAIVEPIFDGYLNRSEQARIAQYSR